MQQAKAQVGVPERARGPSVGGLVTTAWHFAVEYVPVAVAIVGLLVIWELAMKLFAVPAFLLPPPSAIAARFAKAFGFLVDNTIYTTAEIVLGFALGALIGFAVAVVMLFSRLLSRVLYPLATLTQTVPKLAIAPLFVVWFGFGILPKVLITALLCLFPVLVNSIEGLVVVDERMLDLMRSINASRWQVFVKVRLPNSLPFLFAGLKIGMTMAVIGGVVAEWIGTEAGLGHLLVVAQSQLQTDLVFATFVMIAILGIALFGLVALVERIVLGRRRPIEVHDQV